jgi:hypothetical protein
VAVLTKQEIQAVKDKVLELINENVHREGTDKLVNWLKSSDFFYAPASTKFHLSCEGGLAKHSLNVLSRLIREVINEFGSVEDSPYSMESLVIVGLMHDLCKVGFYKKSMRNQKNEETGQWEKVPFYMVEDELPIPHGPKSQYILRSFIQLSREESIAIISHMGGFDSSVKGGEYAIRNALGKYTLATLLHVADLKATNIDERE